MSDTYSCTVAGCGGVFTKAWELKKHKVLHERPERVHICPECAFYTLYEKNLAIHVRKHTNEKLQCPDMVTFDGISTRCEYRTKDPTPLLKHRKKVHGYVPNANRGPRTGDAPARSTDGNAPLRYAPYPRPALVPNHKPPQASTSGSTDSRLALPPSPPLAIQPPTFTGWSPSLWQSNVGTQGPPNPVSYNSSRRRPGTAKKTIDWSTSKYDTPYPHSGLVHNHKPPQASTSASGSADRRPSPLPPAPPAIRAPIFADWSPPLWRSTVGKRRQPNPVGISSDAGDAADSLFSPSPSRSPSPPPAQQLHLTVWAPLFLQSNVGAQGPPDPAEATGYAPPAPTSEPATSYDEPAMDLNMPEDPSLDPNWMARYAQTYSAFE